MNKLSLPVCEDIERLVLGCSLAYSDSLDASRSLMEADYFSVQDHRLIWARICELYDSGQGVDYVTVYKALQAHNSPVGLTYLTGLVDGLPLNARISGYVDRLRDAHVRRRLILEARSLALRAADESESLDAVLNAFANVSMQLTVDGGDAVESTRTLIDKIGISALLAPRRHRGVHLPWRKLDDDLCGIGPGQMVVLLAATSRGKTSMALQIATSAAKQGYAPLIWTMEMSPRSLFNRMVNQISGVRGTRQPTFQERTAQQDAVGRLNDQPVYFDSRSRSVGAFMSRIRQVRCLGAPVVGLVDYLQRIPSAGGSRANRAQEVAADSRALKSAAMDLDIPLLVLSQVDRGSVKGDDAEIGLFSGKESGGIENDADVVMWIQAGKLSREDPTLVHLHIGKQREGPAGFANAMIFNPISQTFEEAEG